MDLQRFAEIQTPRLTLAPVAKADPDALFHGLNDLDVSRWLTRVAHPYSRVDAQAYIASLNGQTKAAWSIYDQGGALIGGVALEQQLGYWLAQDGWGRGYATEAARAVLDAHFSDPDAGTVGSSYFLGNDASARVLAKLGFTDIAPRKLHSLALGREVDAQEVRLTRESHQVSPLFALRTARLKLDALTLDDLPVVHAEWGVPEVARMMATIKADWTLDEAKTWIKRSDAPSRAGLGLAVRLHDGTLVGSVALGGDPFDLGYMFAPQHWGKGYASEAVGAFLHAVFQCFDDLNQVDATVFDDNPASARVLQKLGFAKIGPSDCQSLARVEPSANTLYRLTRSSLKG